MNIESIIEYLIVYILGGFSGWVIEKIYYKKHNSMCGDTFNRKFLKICLPFLHVWALGALILAFLSNNVKNTNIILLAIAAVLFLTSMECVAGKLSLKINNYKTWDYSDDILCGCDGYVCLTVSLYWFLCSVIFLYCYPSLKDIVKDKIKALLN